jgi:hypothetical protein
MPDGDALTGASSLLTRADLLAARLRRYHPALRHLLEGSPENLVNRLRILCYLLQETSVPANELLGTGTAPAGELAKLYELGIIKPTSNAGFQITQMGESLITFLLFFDADVRGALSEGFGQILHGLLESQLDAGTGARLVIGGARRLSEDLQEVTAVGELRVLDAGRDSRKKAVDHVGHMVEKLHGHISPVVEADLRSAANDLNAAFFRQDATHTKAILRNVRYPSGHTHATVTASLGRHSLASLAQAMQQLGLQAPRPVRVAVAPPPLEQILGVLQRPAMPVVDVTITMRDVEDASPKLRESLRLLELELADAPDGAALHEAAHSPLTYNAGAMVALVPDHPWRKRLPFTFHVDPVRRVRNEGAYVDVPYITVQRTPHA